MFISAWENPVVKQQMAKPISISAFFVKCIIRKEVEVAVIFTILSINGL